MAVSIPDEGYCEAVDVTALTGKEYSTTTKPSAAQVETLIKQTADHINGILGAVGLAIPVAATATRAQRILRLLNSRGAAIEAENAVPGLREASPRSIVWQDAWQKQLAMLARRQLDLIDADRTLMPTQESNQSPDGAFNVSDGVDAGPTFTREDQV